MVAITKCDKASARPEEARQQLLAQGVQLEAAGGTVQARGRQICPRTWAESGLGSALKSAKICA